MRFDVDDEDAFHAAREELVARFEARLTERGESLDLASDADLLLDWKWGYADGDLSWWRTGHLNELLLEWYPRKVSGPPDLVQLTIPSIAAFIGFLGEEGLLSAASDPADTLRQHVLDLRGDFEAAMGDTSKFGMAKSLFAAVGGDIDPDDPSSIQRVMDAFNALPYEERDRVLAGPVADMTARAGLRYRFRPVVLPDPAELAEAAREAPWYRRILDFIDWVGDGRPLTEDTNNVTLAGARELIDILEADEVMDEQIGDRAFKTQSSRHLPTVDLAYRWARAAGLVKVRKGRLTRTARGEAAGEEDPAVVLRRLAETLVDEVGILAHRWRDADPYAWGWHAETVDEFVTDWLLRLYDSESADIDDLTDEAWDALEYEFDLSRVPAHTLQLHRDSVGHDVLWIFRMLEGVGMVAVSDVQVEEERYPSGYVHRRESGGNVTITPLGTWVVHARASALGETTVVGELVDVDADVLLDRVLDLPEDGAGAEIDAWLAARAEDDAVAALAAALPNASDTALVVAFKALLRIGVAAAATVSALYDDPRLGPYARVWEVDAMSVDVGRVRSDDPSVQARVVAAALDMWGDTAPSRWAALVVGTDDPTTLADAVAAWWNVDGDDVTEVLELLGRDDRKPVAKAARKALFKRRSAR